MPRNLSINRGIKAAPRKRDSGVALILALLFIALLTVLVVEFCYDSEVEASFATNQGSDLEAYLAARSAVAKGIGLLAEDLVNTELDGQTEFDSEFDVWAAGIPFEPINEATMRTTIADEYGKINLNALMDASEGGKPEVRPEVEQALRELFRLRETDNEDAADMIVDSIIDWVDYDDGDEEQPNGAENDYYTSLENPYPCKNGPMDSIEELLLIKGITPELYFGNPKLEPPVLPLPEYLTVHGDWQGRINPNTAREETIAAVVAGFTDSPADIDKAMLIYEDARTEPFMDTSQLSQLLPAAQEQPQSAATEDVNGDGVIDARDSEASQGATVDQVFTITSNVFRIYGDGMLEDVLVRIEAFVWRTPLDPSALEVQSGSQQTPATNANLAGDPLQGATIPGEPFRILDWKVIR